MPFTTRLAPLALRAPAARSVGATRSFRACAPVMAGKESALHNEARPEEAENLKQQQLKEQKEGKGQWKEGLASDSESAVKADRGDQSSSRKSIKEMQEDTAKAAQQEKKP
ncbi:hypothetical protein Q7P37_008678 [Cladosporium fusiforme]